VRRQRGLVYNDRVVGDGRLVTLGVQFYKHDGRCPVYIL